VSIYHSKMSGFYARVSAGVVAVFCPCQSFSPFLRLSTSETPQIHLQGAVYYFGLPICLRMVGITEIEACSVELEKFGP